MINELDDIILDCDIHARGLTRGDIGTVVLVHNGGEGFEVEFAALDGEPIAVVSLRRDQIRPAHEREIAHARELGECAL
jgi:hypothetical protein